MGQTKLYFSKIMFNRGRADEIEPGTLFVGSKLFVEGDEALRDQLLADELIRPADEAEIALWEKTTGRDVASADKAAAEKDAADKAAAEKEASDKEAADKAAAEKAAAEKEAAEKEAADKAAAEKAAAGAKAKPKPAGDLGV